MSDHKFWSHYIFLVFFFCSSKSEKLNNMTVTWMNEGIALSTGQKVDTRLCPTRRSAGLPFLILVC